MSDLEKLLARCKCGVHITVNEHRNYYQTAEQALLEMDERDLVDLTEEVKERMIYSNIIISCQFYPNTPIGFYEILHYDFNACIKLALQVIEGKDS